MVNPSLRSQLRDSLQIRCETEGWRALIAQHGTPLLVLDPYRVVEQCRLLASQLRGFRLHYAVRTSSHPAVLRAVAAAGCGFDVATRAEVDLVGALGFSIDRCINTNPVKKPADIDHAYIAGVRTFVVDNPVEAQKFAGLPADVEVLVRLAFGNPTATSDLSTKFGVPPAEAELVVKDVLTTGVRFGGFSFHVGSHRDTVERYREALVGTLDLIAHIGETLGVQTQTIDIGGGFPVTYRETMPTVENVAAVVDEVLGDRRDEFTLVAEPGRFLAADSMTLLTSVIGSAVRDGRQWHYLDGGIHGSYSNVMAEDVHPPILAMREIVDGVSGFQPVTLAGPTCDGADVVARDYPMPTLNVGDLVVSPMMGAHTAVTSSRFNGVPATTIVEV
jgi:ornithine decarboxylase